MLGFVCITVEREYQHCFFYLLGVRQKKWSHPAKGCDKAGGVIAQIVTSTGIVLFLSGFDGTQPLGMMVGGGSGSDTGDTLADVLLK